MKANRKGVVNKEQALAEKELELLGISLDELDRTKLFTPVFEEMVDEKSLYVKFMSDGGVLDEELGTRFATVCERLNRSWESERKRSGSILISDWPALYEYLKKEFYG